MIKKYFAALLCIVFFSTGAYAQCSADFSNSTSGLFTYGFIYLDNPAGLTYSWNFGDGGTSTDENPSHTFAGLGTYIVCLTVHSTSLNCSATSCDTIVIACPAVAGMSIVKGSDYTYDFNYTSSSNDQVTWHWDFGDGTTATTRTATHGYAKTGTYHVCLTVTDVSIGCTADSCIDLSVCVAEASFTHGSTGQFDYNFTDQSLGEDASTTYLWTFGDGDSSRVQNPTHVYTRPGAYGVCLTIDVVDSGCANTRCNAIQVACNITSNFSYTNIGGLTFQFTDLSTGEDSSVTYTWGFDPGASALKNPVHTYSSTGSLDATLLVENADQGCMSSSVQSIALVCNDSAGFNYTVTGTTFHFSDASRGEDTSTTYAWTFGDGGTSTAKNPAHTYTSLGAQQVCLTMTAASGICSSKFCESITVTCPLATSFTYNSADSSVAFQDGSAGEDGTSTYQWTFGDGDSSTSRNPTHIYQSSGSYQVCLLVTDADFGCSNQYCHNVLVNTTGCPDTAKFTYTNIADTFNFQDASKNVGGSAGYFWSFGDGDTSILQNPTHDYSLAGPLRVCLVITDATNSCSSEYCDSINVVSGIAWINSNDYKIRLYPNPATGYVNIDLNGFKASIIIIYNQLGEKVKQVITDGKELNTINVSGLPAGIYLVSAKSDDEVFSSTLIVTNR